MNTNDFSVAKVGDTCWSSLSGEGTISEIITYTEYPIRIKSKFTNLMADRFTIKGEYIVGGPQCLFHGKPEIIAPERPKRLVEKVVKVRPFLFGSQILKVTHLLNEEDIGYCGPEQDITIEVWEE